MKYKIVVTLLFFIMFHPLMAQQITIDIKKLNYNVDETIDITYRIEKQVDSAAIENKNFTIVSGPNISTTPNFSEVSFVLKAFTIGRIKVPTLTMHCKDENIKSNDLFVEITNKEFTSEDLKLIAYKTGHSFNVILPAYLSKTAEMNSSSGIEFKSEKDDVHGYVFFENKKNKNIRKSFSANEYYELFIKDFMIEQQQRKVSKQQFLKKGEINFIESEMTFFDKAKKKKMYYFIGIAETDKAFYQFISWTPEDKKVKIKTDFENIFFSIKD
ncbi:hypothetical protein [Flavobacterium sp. KJJ]|uniref:hypothetical protein n=1 Tax=Flavobacterium sp. KJJ TaxID=1270193 RepID=UPI000A69836A|nr:hypothetical protein [Flavobacterium sp. KJJ]